MARYYPVSPQFWTDTKVKRWDNHTRTLALYVLTCPHRNLEGLYHLPPLYVQADLGWTPEAIDKALAKLEEDGFILMDPAADVVLIRQALKYQQPNSKKHIQGALNALEKVPENSLHGEFLKAAETYAPKFHKVLVNGFPVDEESLSEGSDSDG